MTYGFVTDDTGVLVGVFAFRELLFAEDDQPLSDIMLTQPFTLQPTASLVDAMREVVTRHYPAYPVVDAAGRLLGMVRGQALFERQAFEISAQAGAMVGVEKEERVATAWPRSFKFRHPWLQLNLLTAFLAAAVVGVLSGHRRSDRHPRDVPAGPRRSVGQHRVPGPGGHPPRHDAR